VRLFRGKKRKRSCLKAGRARKGIEKKVYVEKGGGARGVKPEGMEGQQKQEPFRLGGRGGETTRKKRKLQQIIRIREHYQRGPRKDKKGSGGGGDTEPLGGTESSGKKNRWGSLNRDRFPGFSGGAQLARAQRERALSEQKERRWERKLTIRKG